ncbi:MAG: YiaA/YiaB family inner membrane protein [Pseudanabaenaceae cyanobacterium bins.68]|nr:YiaA/YiaB family inner membrane protein [Pseudanabaenaceae cyanobacterium bins.68]
MNPVVLKKDTQAWVVQVWVSFVVSVAACGVGIAYLPVNDYVKAFTGVSFLYAISSSFTLAKTLRDREEVSRVTARIDEARVEKILAEHHPLK